jgi:hypothetical protein
MGDKAGLQREIIICTHNETPTVVAMRVSNED